MKRDKLQWRSIACVFLPFAAGYYLSYLYRTINALIARDLVTDLSLSSSELGFLTSVFFLSFAAIQLPLGIWLDRYGPRRVQLLLLPAASLGALVFATSQDLTALIIGRALIGLGVAAALMAGFKALVMTVPPAQLPLLNGVFVALGTLGAISATVPADWLLQAVGWRGLFAVLAAVTLLYALLIYVTVPRELPRDAILQPVRPRGFRAIALSPDFIRLAPLSASCVGTAWSIHGLWASSWLADVERLSRPDITRYLLVMGICLCVGAFAFGLMADRLQRRGVSLQTLILATAAIFMTAETALILRWPASSYLLFGIIAAMGAATVLSFSLLRRYFPKEIAGQANAALNIAHVTAAFLLQYVTGLIIQQWPAEEGHVPLFAYQAAFGVGLALQFISLPLFMWPIRGNHRATKPSGVTDVQYWRRLAVGSALLSIALGGTLAVTNVRAEVWLSRVETAATGREKQAVPDAAISYLLTRFIENVRSLSTDAVVVRSRWLQALDYSTPVAAKLLNGEVKSPRFTQIGARAIMIELMSVWRASDDVFEVRWTERALEGGQLVQTDHFAGTLALLIRRPERRSRNPFGLYIDDFKWALELAESHSAVAGR
jgi:type IV secretory pathway TrbF-like protein/predicted MFS family arabinose efflux permease